MKRDRRRCSGKVLWKASGKPGRKPGKESEKVVPFCLERCRERCLKRYGLFIIEKWSGKVTEKLMHFHCLERSEKGVTKGGFLEKGGFPDWKCGWKGDVERGLERRLWRFWKGTEKGWYFQNLSELER